MSAHRPRITRTGRTHPWRITCRCGVESEWRFWNNALRRAERHAFMPGVFR